VVNPEIFIKERDGLNARGVDTGRVFISDRAHLVLPYHILLDGLEEKARGVKSLGTTLRGIGPAFVDKVARMGIRAVDLLEKAILRDRLEYVLEYKNQLLTKLYGAPPVNFDELFDICAGYADQLRGNIKETSSLLDDYIRQGKKVIMEGAQGALLDTDFGTYPYTTSSSPLTAGGCLGAGIGPVKLDRAMGVFKAYCSRVGSGPMPTELSDATGELIRKLGHEYGTTTGRPRRIGWFDGVAGRFSGRINGLTGIAITRLDILDTLETLKVCTGYRLGGDTIHDFPADAATLSRCRPIYEEMSGWSQPTTEATCLEELPYAARAYIARLEELVGCSANYVCIGPVRRQAIELTPIL
jgi:adenylosuccinate synthase